jgi:hypothetical protein
MFQIDDVVRKRGTQEELVIAQDRTLERRWLVHPVFQTAEMEWVKTDDIELVRRPGSKIPPGFVPSEPLIPPV